MIDPTLRPQREIRANYSDDTIRVYQAYSREIAEPALAAQRFVSPFKMTRMTWIKPSFFWMMYRSGWATKPGQERILAIDIERCEFDWSLLQGCLSHFDPEVYDSYDEWVDQKQLSPVRIQWDPERNYNLERFDYRSLQVGLSGDAAKLYTSVWIRSITDITDKAKLIRFSTGASRNAMAAEITDEERPYPISMSIAQRIGAST